MLEREVPANFRNIYTSKLGRDIPNLLVFKPIFAPEPIQNPQDDYQSDIDDEDDPIS